jgi:DNA-binding PadR family transcriptional regulator
MELDTDKIDQAVLALLSLGRHEGYRVWKSFDWEVMNRLHAKGYITDPVSKARSVLLTEEGARESERLLYELFGRPRGGK